MADNIVLNPGTGGATVKTLEDGSSNHWPVGVVAYATTVGTPDILTVPVAAALADNMSNPTTLLNGSCALWWDGSTWDRARGDSTDGLLVNLGTNNDVTVTGSLTSVTSITNVVQVADNSGSLTVDAPVGTPVFVRLSDGSSAISTLPVSLASVPSHAVTNAGTFAVQESGAALTALQLIDNLVLAEDAVHVSGDPGVQLLAVRKDAGATIAGTDGDYSPLQVDASGNLRVNIMAGAGSGGTASTDDAAFTVAVGSGTPMMGIVTADSVDSGDVGVVGMLANRQLKVTLYDSAGTELSVGGGTQYTEDAAAAANPIGNALIVVRDDARAGTLVSTNGDNVALRGTNSGELYVKHVDTIAATQSGTWTVGNASGASAVNIQDGGNSITVDGTITANAGTNLNTSLLALESGGNLATIAGAIRAEDAASADLHTGIGILAVRKATPVNTSGTDGDYEFLQISAGRLWASATIDAALPTGTNIIGGVTGNVAHDGVDSGAPNKIGAKATTSISAQTAVANGDRTDLFAGVDGVPITRNHANLEDIVQERATNTDGASTAFASGLAAPGAGLRLWITAVTLCNSSASFITVDLRDGAAGSVLWTIPVPATGGAIQRFDPPLKLTANTALAYDASAATTTMTISANGFKSKI